MAKFFMAYHDARQIEDPDEQKAHMGRYQQWMQKYASQLSVAAAPLGAQWTVDAQGGREGYAGAMMGYSVVEADSLEAALVVAQACPFCEIGTIQLAQIMEMPGG